MKKVVIIGGGASGLIAALSASEDKNNEVFLIEKQDRVGKKLLATGNGRCNLTNDKASYEKYSGKEPGFSAFSMNLFSPEVIMEFFKKLGLFTVIQYGGRVFPASDSANSVVDVLRMNVTNAGVNVITGKQVTKVKHAGGRFEVFYQGGSLTADNLIVACGGKAGGKLGGCIDGYEILKSLGHSCTELYPSLVPIYTDTDYPRSLKGVRVHAKVLLEKNSRVLDETEGEVQFTENGISGPASFDISRKVSMYGGTVHMDLADGFTAESIKKVINDRVLGFPDMEAGSLLIGIVHNRLATVLVKYCDIKPSEKAWRISPSAVDRLAQSCKDFCLNTNGTGTFENAQVTAGGIRTSEFVPETMESRIVSGLYACGEVLDIDGPCGGYNLQWAWASGMLAGKCYKKETE